MYDQTESTGLTLAHIKALREATDLCFAHDPDGSARIRAIYRPGGVATSGEITTEIPVDLSRVDNYGTGSGPWSCFHMAHSAQHTPHVATLVRSLRPGNQIRFIWLRDNSSPVTRDAGVVIDELYVEVLRRRQRGLPSTDRYMLTRSVSLDNTARMIRC